MGLFKSKKTYTSSKGLSCCFRQFKAESHCKYLHGYSLQISVEFKATELDERNWVVDFGGLKNLEQEFKNYFDHKTLIDKNDPHIKWFETGQDAPDFRPSAHIHYSKSDLDYTLDVNRIFDNLYAEDD